MYDVSKENDKEFLREAVLMLQEELLETKIEVILLKKLKEKDEEVLLKISEEL